MNIDRLRFALAFALIFACGCSPQAATDATKDASASTTAPDDNQADGDSHDQKPHWSYTGDTGPEHWADLDPNWAVAREGKEQSPINIVSPAEKGLPPIEFHYEPSRINIINNGHTIQVNYDAGSSISVDGQTYELAQFHFHAPSEHTIDGKSSDMEMHLVHKSAQGKLVVVGVMINPGAANPAFESLWQHLPMEAGDEQRHEDRGRSLISIAIGKLQISVENFIGSLESKARAGSLI